MTHSIDLQAMIEFYDENVDARKHSNAVKTLGHEEFAAALFCHYLKEIEGKAGTVLDDRSCLPPSGNNGKRLDRWIKVEDAGKLVFYQTEVKAASFHGYSSGKAIPTDRAALRLRMSKDFKKCWNAAKGRFLDEGLDKVLQPMRLDELKGEGKPDEVRPLACLWAPLHPNWNVKISSPFFEVSGVKDSEFKSVWVFSASACLRQYLHKGIKHLDLKLTKMAATQDYVDGIYRRHGKMAGNRSEAQV